MHIDRSGMPYKRFTPYRLEELRSAQGMPHMRDQHPKKIEFLYRELHGFPLHRARMRVHIKVDARCNEARSGSSLSPLALRATIKSANTGYQLHHAERLCQVIIGT